MPTKRLEERLSCRGHRNAKTGCLEWTGAQQRYGLIRVARKTLKVHRVAWTLAHGPIPDGMNVLHRCDNCLCFDVAHLFLGTQADNVADMCAKGRQVAPKATPGRAVKQARLSVDDVRQIRASADFESQRSIAGRYGITFQHVSDIVRRKRWAHV